MLKNLKQDTRKLRGFKSKSFPWYVLESLLFENGYQAIVLYRIAHWFKKHRVPFLGPFFARLSLFLTGVDIAAGAEIGPGLIISHGTGLVIGDRVRIGRDATLLHQVTIGAPSLRGRSDMPRLGDNVFVGAGARIIGDIEIGDGAKIAVNSVVTESIPPGGRVQCGSATEIVIPDLDPSEGDD